MCVCACVAVIFNVSGAIDGWLPTIIIIVVFYLFDSKKTAGLLMTDDNTI